MKMYLTIIQRQASIIEILVDLQLLDSEKNKWQQCNSYDIQIT